MFMYYHKKQASKVCGIEIKEYTKASHIWIIENYEEEKELVQNAYDDLINQIL